MYFKSSSVYKVCIVLRFQWMPSGYKKCVISQPRWDTTVPADSHKKCHDDSVFSPSSTCRPVLRAG